MKRKLFFVFGILIVLAACYDVLLVWYEFMLVLAALYLMLLMLQCSVSGGSEGEVGKGEFQIK